MTNGRHIAEELSNKCKGYHVHQHLTGGRAKEAQEYPEELCRAMCTGLLKEMNANVQQIKCLMNVKHDTKVGGDSKKEGAEHLEDNNGDMLDMIAWDDLIGEELDGKKVRQARLKEIGYVHEKKVWRKMKRSEAIRRGIKIVDTRWIDINKGDTENPVFRSRLVAKEFNDSKDMGIFASTPPLEALRTLLSEAGTRRKRRKGKEVVMMLNDVARAFFEAKATRELCIELPDEDKTEKDQREDNVAILEKSLYGTRDAANNFQKEIKSFMLGIGLKIGRYNASTYHHGKFGLKTMVHGDDFVTVGGREETKWLVTELKKRFEFKTVVIGNVPEEVKESKILNRVVRVTPRGWEYEADPRHAELIVKALNLEEAKA